MREVRPRLDPGSCDRERSREGTKMKHESWIRPTLHEVADEAHVSISTASRVVNRRDDLVTPETQARVWEAIRKLGYSPNRAARTLRAQGSSVVGVVVPDLANPYYSLLIRGAQQAASDAAAALLVCGSSLSRATETQAINLLYDEGVQGVVLLSADETSEEAIQQLLRARIAVVAVHRRVQGIPIVKADTSRGAYSLGLHLLDVGYRRLAVISGPEYLSTFVETRDGVERAIHENGSGALQVLHGEFSYEFGYDSASRLLRNGTVDAIVAQNDMMAMGALHAAADLGISVPDSLGIAGIGQLPWAEQMRPKLTTVHLPFAQMGREAIQRVLQAGSQHQTAAESPILVPRLVIGDTTCRNASN